jgi:4,5-DOPA dioxygenase extradiol
MTEKMPVLFVGHGSPMNAIEENEFAQGARQQLKELREEGVLIVSSGNIVHNLGMVVFDDHRK